MSVRTTTLDGTMPVEDSPPKAASRRHWAADHRRWRWTLPAAVACADAAAAVLALAVAAQLTQGVGTTDLALGDRTLGYAVGAGVLAPVWALTLAAHGGYAHSILGTAPAEPRRVLRAGIAFFAIIAVIDLLWATEAPVRLVVLVAAGTVLFTLVARLVGARVVHRAREQGRWMRRVVVYGAGPDVQALAGVLAAAPQLGAEVVGTCTTDAQVGESLDARALARLLAEAPHVDAGAVNGHAPDARLVHTAGNGAAGGAHRSVAGVDDPGELVLRVVSSTGADVLAVAAGTPPDRLRALAWALEGTGIELLVAPATTGVARHTVALHPVGDLPLLRVEGCRLAGTRLIVKNVVDRVSAALLLVLLSPVLIAVAAAVKLTTPGPVLYRQTRVGQHGGTFSFLKFRTMVADADSSMPGFADCNEADRQFKVHLAGCNEADGLLFKLHDDPRVTRLGRVLRRYSVDELPQLWHVLCGEMSLVGPRPLAVSPEDFAGDARRRLRVKPGITGLWQVSGGRNLSWEDTVRLDLEYVDRWSLLLEVMILLRTPAAVVRRRGVY
jgi:exopolysaccharide biosynthesis polyprenyl glycosylphosphotransferase